MSETDEAIDSPKAETKKPRTRKKKTAKKRLYELVNGKPDLVPMDWLDRIANEYRFDKIEHVPKFAAFRCFQNNRCVEWINYKELANENNVMRFHVPCKILRSYTRTGKRLFKTMR